jgi:integrase
MEIDPIRDLAKISQMTEILKQKVRDELLFVLGINSALRIGDLLSLSVGDVTDDEGKIVETIILKEQKTGKSKRIAVNDSIKKSLSVYLMEHKVSNRSEPLFQS